MLCSPFVSLDEDDAALVAAVAGRGEDACRAERAFCERYAPRVRRYAERHLRDHQAAADLTHEVLLVALEAMREARVVSPERLGSFVLSTCRFLVWDENRGEARRRRLQTDLVPDGLDDPLLPLGDRVRLEHCVDQLAPRERSVVLLTYCEEWPAERIAIALGTTAGNVRVIRHRSLSQLAVCMEASA